MWPLYERRQPSFGQIRRPQKVVVSRGIQLQIVDALVVDKNVIQIPEVDVGQFLGEDELQFGVGRLALRLVDFATRLVDQGVDFRVGIVATIGAVRRKARRAETQRKNIRVFVAADPAQPVKLECTMGHVRKEGSELEATNI